MPAITETKFFELVDFNKTEARVPLGCEYWLAASNVVGCRLFTDNRDGLASKNPEFSFWSDKSLFCNSKFLFCGA